jgi:hypothetical protein
MSYPDEDPRRAMPQERRHPARRNPEAPSCTCGLKLNAAGACSGGTLCVDHDLHHGKDEHDDLTAADLARVTAERDEARAVVARLRADFPPAPPLPVVGCECDACERLARIQRTPDERRIPSAREAARRRMPLDGTDAQALEGAIAITERERDEAREAINAVRGVNVDAIVERDEAQAKARAFEAGWRLAEADARRLRELGTEIVGHFWQHGHPVAPCLRTGWVGVGAVAEWRAALATGDTTTPRSARQAADERAEDGER